MQVIKPVTFADAMLVSTTATEATAAWNSGTTYALNAEVSYSNSIYVSLQASNLNHQPDTSPTWWLRKSATNPRKMFDGSVDSQTTATTSMTVVLATGMINSLALLNLTGNTLNVTGRDGLAGPTVYTKSINLDGTIIVDWYEYFFEPYDNLTEVVFTDIPPYSGMHLTIEIVGGTGNTVGIGGCVFGTTYTLGQTQYGASVGIKDYSVKEVDQFGITQLVQRAFSRRMEATVFVDNGAFNKVYKLLSELRATPCVYIGSQDDRFNPTIIYGYYRDFSTVIQYPTMSMCSIEIEGLS